MLVATSVAEEGLDIRQCNVVIRFDLAKTVLAYIQSRGRARKPGSDYILMVERYIDSADLKFQIKLENKPKLYRSISNSTWCLVLFIISFTFQLDPFLFLHVE